MKKTFKVAMPRGSIRGSLLSNADKDCSEIELQVALGVAQIEGSTICLKIRSVPDGKEEESYVGHTKPINSVVELIALAKAHWRENPNRYGPATRFTGDEELKAYKILQIVKMGKDTYLRETEITNDNWTRQEDGIEVRCVGSTKDNR